MAAVVPLDVRAEQLLDGLYRTHAPGALRFALMLTGDRALSEDLVQEAFIRVAARHERAVDERTLISDAVDVTMTDTMLVALRRLPMQQRAVVVLRYYNQL